MLRHLILGGLAALGFASGASAEAPPASARTENVAVTLIAERDTVAPGESVTLALRQQIREGWHTYWLNPGDSGEPTRILWTLPEGATAGDLAFPAPKRIPVGPLVNFGFYGEAWLLTELQVPADAVPGSTVDVVADATWLVCEEICIPEEAKLGVTLPVAAEPAAANPLWAKAFAKARAALPEASPWPAAFRADGDGTLALALQGPDFADAGIVDAAFFPYTDGFIANAAAQVALRGPEGLALVMEAGRKLRTPDQRAAAAEIAGVIVLEETGGVRRAFGVAAIPGEIPAGTPLAADAGGTPGTSGNSIGLLAALGLALAGGILLNLMPCVFPVLSIKALAIARHAGDAAAPVRRDALAYAAGVLVTFALVGGALLIARAGGEAVGWGFQLQSPVIVAALAILMLGVGLNLSGVFEITGGGNAGAGLAARGGPMGAFFTGALAVVVATPCTAPFMATALGWAVVQPAAVAMAVFLALGLGLAAPFLVFAAAPGLAARLPKPGAWMVRLKEILAFPMYGAALWLFWVLAQQTDAAGLALALGAALAAAFGAWALGAAQRSAGGLALGGTAAAAGAAALAALVMMPAPLATAARSTDGTGTSGGLAHEAWSPQRVAELRAAGTPVFVNFTAAWCVTCLVNERVALSTDTVARVFADAGVVYLKADWTNRDAVIARTLEAHGRSGVPLYLFYAPGAEAPAILPQILTPGLVAETVSGPDGPRRLTLEGDRP